MTVANSTNIVARGSLERKYQTYYTTPAIITGTSIDTIWTPVDTIFKGVICMECHNDALNNAPLSSTCQLDDARTFIFDDKGKRLLPNLSNMGIRAYRYYTSSEANYVNLNDKIGRGKTLLCDAFPLWENVFAGDFDVIGRYPVANRHLIVDDNILLSVFNESIAEE
jgi:hypothetical protein